MKMLNSSTLAILQVVQKFKINIHKKTYVKKQRGLTSKMKAQY